MNRRWILLTVVAMSLTALIAAQDGAPQSSGRSRTRLVMLGTGNPGANPDRFGPASVVLIDNVPYLVDMGAGVVRRWTAAVKKHQLGAPTFQTAAIQLRTAFVTHLHTDHTIGYPDLIFTPWVQGGSLGALPGFPPLEVFGPKGLRAMTDHILAAYADDIRIRTGDGGERPGGIPPIVNVHEVDEGVVFKDERVTVTAFRVPHGTWPQAFGYRFDGPDKRIVISGDTAFSLVVAEQCHGCDILVHEDGRPENARSSDLVQYGQKFHTNAEELAQIANLAKPKLLVLYHQQDANEDGLRIIRALYTGRVVVANDLDIFE